MVGPPAPSAWSCATRRLKARSSELGPVNADMRIDAHQHFWRYDARRVRLDRRLDGRAAARLPAGRRRARDAARAGSTRASPCRRGRPSRKRGGCCRSPKRTRSSPASSAGSICRRRTCAPSSNSSPATRSWSACATSCRASPTIASCCGPEFGRGLALLEEFGLAYDLLVYSRHLPVATEFAGRFAGQRFVLDHLGEARRPRRRDSRLVGGRAQAGRVSERLVQAVRARHGGGLGGLEAGAAAAVSRRRVRLLWRRSV